MHPSPPAATGGGLRPIRRRRPVRAFGPGRVRDGGQALGFGRGVLAPAPGGSPPSPPRTRRVFVGGRGVRRGVDAFARPRTWPWGPKGQRGEGGSGVKGDACPVTEGSGSDSWTLGRASPLRGRRRRLHRKDGVIGDQVPRATPTPHHAQQSAGSHARPLHGVARHAGPPAPTVAFGPGSGPVGVAWDHSPHRPRDVTPREVRGAGRPVRAGSPSSARRPFRPALRGALGRRGGCPSRVPRPPPPGAWARG